MNGEQNKKKIIEEEEKLAGDAKLVINDDQHYVK